MPHSIYLLTRNRGDVLEQRRVMSRSKKRNPTRQQRKQERALREREHLVTQLREEISEQLSTKHSVEKSAKNDSAAKAQPKQQKVEHEDVSFAEVGKDMGTIAEVLIPVVITILLAAVALPWVAHPYISLWASFVAVLLLDYLVYVFQQKRSRRDAHRHKLIKGTCVVIALLSLLGASFVQYRMWKQPEETARKGRPQYGQLTPEQWAKLQEALKASPPPHEKIVLGCGLNEEACVFAGEFLNLFRRAGWEVENNSVRRFVADHPVAGIVVSMHGVGKHDPSNPDSGLWAIVSQSRIDLGNAFSSIGLTPHFEADPKRPEGTILVFFGVAPSEEEQEKRREEYQRDLQLIKSSGGNISKP